MVEFRDECDYLIHLVKAAIHNEQPQELPESLDFERVYQFGLHHQVANIAFYSVEKLENKPQGALYTKWEACRNRAMILDINQRFSAEEIRSSLQAANIRFLEMQGTKIKPLYPQTDYRTMSDIDFIIDTVNLTSATEVLERLGYQCEVKSGVEIDAFRAPNVHVELHTDFFPEDCPYIGVLGDPFAADLVNGFYIYNMLHIAKHYFWKGCGVRRVLDAYYLNHKYSGILNQEYVQSTFERAGVTDFVRELSTLAERWFAEGVHAGRSDMECFILNSGAHGTPRHRVENRLNLLRKEGARFYKLRYIWTRISGNREMMYTTYPVLKRYKILYPFCWLHRLFRALRPKRIKELKNETKAVMLDQSK